MFLIFCFIIILGTFIDYRVWKKVTPLMISYCGVFFIAITHALFGENLGFIPINNDIYIYLLIFYIVGLCASISCAFSMVFIIQGRRAFPLQQTIYSAVVCRKIVFISSIVILLCAYFVYSSWGMLGSFVSEDFEKMLTYGVAGHTFVVLVALIPFIVKVYYSRKSKVILLMIFVMLTLLFMKQVKYWVMIPLVWIFWYSFFSGYIKLTFTKGIFFALLITIILILCFFSVYFMKVIFSSDDLYLDYSVLVYEIMIHFFGYLYSGILTFSVYVSNGVYDNLKANDIIGLISGPVNVINVLTDSGLIELDITRPFVVLNPLTGTAGNVPSLWGTLLLSGGYFSFIIYFIIIFVISVFQWMARYSTLFTMLYTFLTSFLFFSWFDYYYYLLMPFEVSVLCVFFYFFFRLSHKKIINRML